MYKVSLFVFTLLLLLACKQGTGNKSPEKAVMQRSKEDTLLTDDRGTDGWYLQKNANRDGGGYTIQTRKLNDSISSIRAVYFVKLDSITLGAGYNRDSSFIVYYNSRTGKVIGFYDEMDGADGKDSVSLDRYSSGRVLLYLKAATYQARSFLGEELVKYRPAQEIQALKNGALFYVTPGTRYFFRLKEQFKNDNAVKEIPLWEGGSRFEAARPIPKELLIHTAEVVTEGNGYYYEIVQGDTAKFKLIAFGESEDDKFGRQVYQYAYWIKWEGFFKYFERF